jgi:hypothetical protein
VHHAAPIHRFLLCATSEGKQSSVRPGSPARFLCGAPETCCNPAATALVDSALGVTYTAPYRNVPGKTLTAMRVAEPA